MNFTDSDNEIMNVMATSFLDNNTRIIVNPADSEPLSCFKYCNTRGYEPKTAVVRISLIRPEYFYNLDDGHPFYSCHQMAKTNSMPNCQSSPESMLGLQSFRLLLQTIILKNSGHTLRSPKKSKITN